MKPDSQTGFCEAREQRRAFLRALADRTSRLDEPQLVADAASHALGEAVGATRVFCVEVGALDTGPVVYSQWNASGAGAPLVEERLRAAGLALLDRFGPGGAGSVDDLAAAPFEAAHLADLNAVSTHALICAPVVRDGCVVMILSVQQNTPRTWTDPEVELAEAVAEYTWEAIGRARAQKALRDSETRHRQLVERAEELAIIRLDQQGVIVAWNTGAARMTGLSEAEVIGRSGEMLFTEEDRQAGAHSRELERADLNGRSVNERWHQRKDGSRFWGSGLMMRLDGTGGGYLKVFRDRTTEHQAETQLRRRSEQLLELAEVATAVARTPTLGQTLDTITRAARSIIGAHQGVVSLSRKPDWSQSIHSMTLTAKYDAWKDYDKVPDGSGIYTWVCEDNRPARFTQAELEAHPRWRGFGAHAKDHPPMRGWLAAPLVGRDGRNLGLIQLSDKEDGSEFDEADEAMLVQLAHLAAGAIEQAQADEALRDLNRSLEQRVLETAAERERAWRVSQELLAVVNGDATFAEINAAWTVLLGWQPDELIGQSLGAFTHPDDLHAAKIKLAALLELPLTAPYEYRLRHRDGSYRWFSWTATYEAGRIYASGRDINAEKARQAELEAAEAARREVDVLYRAYFENTPEPLFVIKVTDDDGFIVEEVNPAHRAEVGLQIDGSRTKRVEELVPPEVAERVLENYRQVLRTGGVYQYRETLELGPEPQYWDTTLVPVWNADGRVARIVGSSRNLTAQIVAEEALRQSQKMEAIGQLTGGIAHDFNNLLTPIVGGLDMLQRRGLGGEREQRILAGAAQSAERARTLVQRLLAFARRQPLQAVSVDIARLVTSMGDLLSSTTGPQIKIVIEAASGLPPAKVDPNQLEMALLNLAVNARDAMPGGGTLHISAAEEEVGAQHRSGLRPGTFIRLSVADTGTGMDEPTRRRAIEPFFSTKGVGKGTGLGLSMVHGLAAQLGGALTIHSMPEIGTNIELWLPVGAEPPAADHGAESPSAVAAESFLTALLVDDEELVRLSTADMLRELGYSVLEAVSAAEALSLVDRGTHFDLLVTDYLMPGMSGADLIYAVRHRKPAVSVLLVTGYAEREGLDPGLPRLTKPFRKDELAASLAYLAQV